MGTNYYVDYPPCPTCGVAPERLHIGKASIGWTFALATHPDMGLLTLDDWIPLLSKSRIVDECGEPVSYEDMCEIIYGRSNNRNWDDNKWWHLAGYMSEADFHRLNYSKRGPAGLLRRQVKPGFCSGHGSGTWDYMVGYFS